MSIYDREYIRVGPRSKSGLGSLRFISFNSWIIIINVLVFLADAALSGHPVPVVVGETLQREVDSANKVTDRILRDQLGNPVPTRVPVVVRDQSGNRFLDPQGRTALNPALGVGGTVYRAVGDKRTGEVVGQQTIVMMGPLQAYGHLSTAHGIRGLEMWRYLTFQFLHASVSHIFFNMFGLWVFGGMVEQYLGSKRYVAFYLTCGIFGAVSYLILNLLGTQLKWHLPGVLTDSEYTPLVGASAGVFGVIMACAYIAPNAIVQLLFPPIPMRLKWMAYGYVVLAAWNLLRGGANAGGDAAHIGGAIAGFFFIRNAHLLRDFFDVFGNSRRGAPAVGVPGTMDIDAAEVDRILGKVARDGLASLSEEERRTLRRASGRQG